jgi:hypothetical protein
LPVAKFCAVRDGRLVGLIHATSFPARFGESSGAGSSAGAMSTVLDIARVLVADIAQKLLDIHPDAQW